MSGPSLGQMLEFADISIGFDPRELGSGSSTGDWINLKNYDRVMSVLIVKSAASSGGNLKFTIEQALTSTGNSSKGLNIKKVYQKKSTANLLDVGQWTASTFALGGTGTTGSTFVTTQAKKSSITAFDVNSADLDVDNKFDWMRVKIADTGVTSGVQFGTLFYMPYNAKYAHDTTAGQSVQAP